MRILIILISIAFSLGCQQAEKVDQWESFSSKKVKKAAESWETAKPKKQKFSSAKVSDNWDRPKAHSTGQITSYPFEVNIGAFSNWDNTQKLVHKMKKSGLSPIVEKRKFGKQTLHVVKIVNIQTENQASTKAQKSLRILKNDLNKVFISKNKKFLRWVTQKTPTENRPTVKKGAQKTSKDLRC